MIPQADVPPCPIAPRPGFCVIIREDAQQYTKLALPGQGGGGRDLMAEGRVLAVGEATLHPAGEWIGAGFAVGDRVLTQGHNGFCTHKINPWAKTIYEVIPFNQVAAVLEEVPAVEEAGVSALELAGFDPEEPAGLQPVLDADSATTSGGTA